MMAASLALTDILQRVADHPWPGCRVEVFGMPVTLMSAGIAAMLIAAVALIAVIVPLAGRWRSVPRGGAMVVELLVVFVRNMIARPALGERAYEYLPFLLTMFCFILAMNLVGILPLEPIGELIRPVPPIGGVATAIPTVCAALAGISLLSVCYFGLKRRTWQWRASHAWPIWLCAALSPLLWLIDLAPRVGGVLGVLMLVPLVALELVGLLGKALALMVRLFANMISGHLLLAVLMMFIVMALRAGLVNVFYVGPFCILASAGVEFLELLVAGLQAYIFTFLTALFLGLYVEPPHPPPG